MKIVSTILLSVLLASLVSCANEPIVQEYMIITPDTVSFTPPAASSTISVTHSCSCPFSWSATIAPLADTAWLTFPNYQSGDKKDVPISINRTKLLADTNVANIRLASNSYGDTTITVIAIR